MKTDFANSNIQQTWSYDVMAYERFKRTLSLATKLGHQPGIEYYSKRIAELEEKYPQLKKELE